jgi:hypothetical protein
MNKTGTNRNGSACKHIESMGPGRPNYSSGYSPRLLPLLALKALICFMLVPATARSTEADPAQAFRDFLEDPPWIKKAVFGESAQNYVSLQQKKKPRIGEGFIIYEASLQPASMYFKTISNGLFSTHPSAGNGFVLGRADGMYWTFHANQTYIHLSYLETGKPPSSPVERSVDIANERLRRFRNLGIVQLRPGSLAWTSSSSFSGLSEGNLGRIQGTILEYDAGRPKKLGYSVEKFPELTSFAYYNYQNGVSFPPKEVARSVLKNGKERFVDTNIITQLEIGLLERSFTGFVPTMFQTSAIAPKVVLHSNDLQYIMLPNGDLSLLDDSPPDYTRFKGTRPFWTRVPLITVLLLLPIPFLCFRAAKHKGG